MEKVSTQTSGRIAVLFLATVILAILPSRSFAQSAPEPLVITGVTANTVGLAWNDIYTDEDGFRLTRTDSWGRSNVFEFPANTTSCLDTNLTTGLTYYYMIVAFNSGGESAPAFNSAVPMPIPAPEPLLITGVTANTVGLAWNDIYTDEDGFRLTRTDWWGNSTVFEFPANTTSYLDTNLTTGLTCYYMIVAFTSGGESEPAFNSAVPTPIPGPEPLLITGVTANTVGLAWNDIYSNEDGFRITRTDFWGNSTVLQFPANTTSYLDTNLTTGLTYYYMIVAFNSGGDSAPAFNSAVPTPIPGPEPLSITGVTANTVGLAWNDIYSNEDGFRITRTDFWGNSTVLEFPANTTSYLDTNLTTGLTYFYMIVAFNSGGDSAPAFNSATPTPIPGPEPLTITGITANTIGLAWNDIYSNEDGFRITRTDFWGNSTVLQFPPNTTSYLDTNLTTGLTYFYMIVAFNSGGDSAPAFNSATPTPIPGPEPLSITGITANTIGLAWNDIYSNEDGFRLTRTDFWGNSTVLEFPANTTSYLDTNLTTGLTYFYMIVAFNSGGDSAPAFNSAVPTPVPGPEPLTITGVTPNTVGLAWNDIYSDEDGFRLERSVDSANYEVIAYLGPDQSSYVDTALTPVTHYYYRVAAFNFGGDSAYAFADVTTPPSPPAAPSGLAATALSQTQIALSWADNAGNETGFHIERSLDGVNFALVTNVPMNVTGFTDTGLSPITTYHYRIIAFNSGGMSAASNIGSATTPDYPPTSPSALVATAVSSNRIDLTWTDNANNETGYHIEGSLDGVNFSQIGTVAANVRSYSVTALSPMTTYYFRVRASNSGGYSGYSNVASATTLAVAPPAAPSNLVLTVVSSSQINLQWNDNSSNEAQFLIERGLNASSFTQIATVGANVRNYSATGLQSNTRYYFRVRAANSAGNSAYSNTAQAKTAH